MIPKATLTSKEAAEYLGISYWLMLELIKRGEINPIRAGGRYLFRQSGLDGWMTKQEMRGSTTVAAPNDQPKLSRAK
ncbi:DNA binding domain, putative [Desulfitobacterium hafniense]|uniref:DNA binding domain, putative n=1 Tax=Desulfitobacterium hafniense TaxID=49338 RepID=A0A098AYS6_DESHA|nr:helix-turn-helix domain-containing protein [Desulfitobacterium hafniense]CDX01257.1 DNA binding domain, putative [Desulfitobacterium hafniense]